MMALFFWRSIKGARPRAASGSAARRKAGNLRLRRRAGAHPSGFRRVQFPLQTGMQKADREAVCR